MELSNRNQQNDKIILEKEQKMTEILTELINLIDGDNLTFSSIEQTTTNIFNSLRKKSLTKLCEEVDPDKCFCSCCGTKMEIKDRKPITVTGLAKYQLKTRYFHCPKCNKYERPILKVLDFSSGFTPEIREHIVLLGQRLPFNEASDILKKLTKIEVSHETIQEITEDIGRKVHQEEIEQVNELVDKDGNVKPKFVKEWASNIPKIKGTAYLEIDGGMVQTKEDGWKEVKTGILFTESAKMQTDKHHIKLNKKVYFSTFEKVDVFRKRATRAAYDFKFHLYENQVVIADGAQWIWDYFDKHHSGAIQILDYFHASEYLGKAYVSLNLPENEDNLKTKDQLFNWLEEGHINKIIEHLIFVQQTKEVTDCIRYFERNISRMNYGEYIRKGFNIGSGAIESAHRIVVQCRMKLSGMYWGKANVQSIVSLRSAYLSGKWESTVKTKLKAA